MKFFSKNILLWVLAVVLTFFMAYYQRVSGPTYPVSGKVSVESETVNYKLLRTHGGEKGALIKIHLKDTLIHGFVEYKRYKSFDSLQSMPLIREGNDLMAHLPHLPEAGKMMYRVVLEKDSRLFPLNEGKFVVLRYKGKVPIGILIPHVFFMFLSLLFGTRAFLSVLNVEVEHSRYLVSVVVFSLFFGGLILGPMVQKYAFGAYWTGWPFGHDLTDNKTFVMFVFWLVAWFKIRKNAAHRLWVIIAMLTMMAVYLIPHSAWGSEIDFTKPQAVKTTIQKSK